MPASGLATLQALCVWLLPVCVPAVCVLLVGPKREVQTFVQRFAITTGLPCDPLSQQLHGQRCEVQPSTQLAPCVRGIHLGGCKPLRVLGVVCSVGTTLHCEHSRRAASQPLVCGFIAAIKARHYYALCACARLDEAVQRASAAA